MEKTKLIKEIKGIIEEDFKNYSDEAVIYDLPIKDQGLDSLDIIELIMKLENKFNIRINDDCLYSCSTPQDLLDLIVKTEFNEMK